MRKAVELELHDIQRLVLRGYSERPRSVYLLLRVDDPDRARRWLGAHVDATRTANALADRARGEALEAHLREAPALIGMAHPRWRREDQEAASGLRLTLAFTHDGLRALGLDAAVLERFIPEFRQGMADPHRSRVLGDSGDNAPGQWRWGGPDNDAVHVLCAVFAGTQERVELDAVKATLGLDESGMEVVHDIPAHLSSTEPFGFRDGISQPRIEGARTALGPTPRRWENMLPPGEFVLGYRNTYKQLPLSPHVDNPGGTESVLAPAYGHVDRLDFGRNGSFLVLRQLQQHVERFNAYVRAQAGAAVGGEHGDQELVAARMVGRWRSGAPMVLEREYDRPALALENDFAYAREDRFGSRCPVGSHIRRANPRDSLTDEAIGVTREVAMKRVNHHRIIRRGRVYPAPGSASKDAETGLVFLAFNANLERQFEFVQQSWIHGAQFDGLRKQRDPLMSGSLAEDEGMTVPRETIRTRMPDLGSFVTVRGGAYFFMPGLRALAYLSDPSRPSL